VNNTGGRSAGSHPGAGGYRGRTLNRPPPQSALCRAEAATWGPLRGAGSASSDCADRPRIRPVDYRPMAKGFCRVQWAPELITGNVAVFVGRNGPWAKLLAKSRIGQDGRQKTDVDGRLTYLPALEWRDRALANRFSKAVIALIRRAHLGDLAD
jgi:hypothetical protein